MSCGFFSAPPIIAVSGVDIRNLGAATSCEAAAFADHRSEVLHILCAHNRDVDDVLSHEPHLKFVRANDIADE